MSMGTAWVDVYDGVVEICLSPAGVKNQPRHSLSYLTPIQVPCPPCFCLVPGKDIGSTWRYRERVK